MIIHTRAFRPCEAATLADLTFPMYRHLLDLPEHEAGRCTRLVAEVEGQPVGLLLAVHGAHQVQLLSLSVRASFRQRGAATALSHSFVNDVLRPAGVPGYTSFTASRPSITYFERVLAATGWEPPVTTMLSVRHSAHNAIRAPGAWVPKMTFPQGWRVIPWHEVTPAQREFVDRAYADPTKLPVELYPARVESIGPVDAVTSLALEVNSEIAGWILTHRLEPTLIRFTAAFVRQDLQARGWMLGLLHESILRGESGATHGIWTTPMALTPMVRFIRRRVAPMADYVREVRETVWRA